MPASFSQKHGPDHRYTEDQTLSHLALTGFLAAMRGNSTTVIPMTTNWLPNDANGRKLNGSSHAPEFMQDHMGFAGDPFTGFTLRAAASHRDSYIDVDKPELSHLRSGHRITLRDRLHQVVNVSSINESKTAIRVSLMPPVRGNHSSGEVVFVDQLGLNALMESADDPEDWNIPTSEINAAFLEAF